MEDGTAIKVSGLGKRYTIGKQKDASLRSTLSGAFKNAAAKGDDFWAIKDIDFEIKRGDVVGIIGKNGAGKSTLLKVLSQITKPTTGRIEINGRVASLLEVGTGFHPELTGRENIYLNGTILGMTRKEVTEKFDDIVEFSGIAKFIDTPVKHYSSGMYVRLAFAVAAHLEPEILIIDEVLAVGDAEFQKKCLGKMKDVAGEGRTVIFVSHDLTAVKKLCTRAILLKDGIVDSTGDTNSIISKYQSFAELNSIYHADTLQEAIGNDDVQILDFSVRPTFGENLTISSGLNVHLNFSNTKENCNLDTTFELRNANEDVIFHVGKFITTENDSKKGRYEVDFKIPENLLNAGNYYFNLIIGENQTFLVYMKESIVRFEIENEEVGSKTVVYPGIIRPTFDYLVTFNA